MNAFNPIDRFTTSAEGGRDMYEPLRLSGTDLLVADRITDLLSAATQVRGDRRSISLRIAWPGRPHPVSGHRPAGAPVVAGQRA